MSGDTASDRVFEVAADLFSLLAAPTRLRILCELRAGEKSVGELLAGLGARQPALSQHLGVLYRGGVLARRRTGSQMRYRIASERVRMLCDAVCLERDRAAAPGGLCAA